MQSLQDNINRLNNDGIRPNEELIADLEHKINQIQNQINDLNHEKKQATQELQMVEN